MKTIAFAHVADLITFAGCVAVFGIAGEGNPAVRLIYGATGLLGIFAGKALVLGIAARASGWLGRRRWAALRTYLVVGALGTASNVIALVAR